MPAQPINSVNFIRRQRWQVERARRRDRAVFWGSGVVFVIGIAITAAVMVYAYSLRRDNDTLAQQIATQQSLANRLAGSEANYIIYTTRLDTLKTLVESRHKNAAAFSFIERLMAPQLSFDQIRIDPQTREIQFLVRAESVVTVEAFLNHIRSPEISTSLTKLKLSEIKRDETGRYSLQVTLSLTEGAS